YAKNSSQNIGLCDNRERTSRNEPPSRIYNQEATIGILKHVCRMVIQTVRHHEWFVHGFKCGANRCDNMPHNPSRVKLGAEKVALKFRAEGSTPVSHQAGM